MLNELIATLTDADFDLTGQLRVIRLQRRDGGVELTLEVQAFSGDFGRQAWILGCAQERISALGSEPFHRVELLHDHVLLAPFVDVQVKLALKGPAAEPKHVIADLWESHRAVAAPWFEFDAFFNRNVPLVELLGATTAVLAEGPSRVLQAYSDVLAAHGLEPHTIGGQAPRRWVDLTRQPEDSALQVLLLPPYDYIIGTEFSARRVSADHLPPVA